MVGLESETSFWGQKKNIKIAQILLGFSSGKSRCDFSENSLEEHAE